MKYFLLETQGSNYPLIVTCKGKERQSTLCLNQHCDDEKAIRLKTIVTHSLTLSKVLTQSAELPNITFCPIAPAIIYRLLTSGGVLKSLGDGLQD